MSVNGLTKVVGIFGYPVKHTLSPAMHNAAFDALLLNYIYIPFEVASKNLRTAVRSLRPLGIQGVNITIPHKEKVVEYIDQIDPLARQIGSVNTIVNHDGVLTGYNTDGSGFIRDIRSKGFNPKGKTALLVGAGGAGRAIAASLSWSGIRKIFLRDQDEKRARRLALSTPRAEHLSEHAWWNKIDECDILINATPLGMHAGDPSPVPASCVRKDIFVYDVIYNRTTALLKAAAKVNAPHSGGLGMLLHQGALAFELWTGKKAPVEAMRKTLLKELFQKESR